MDVVRPGVGVGDFPVGDGDGGMLLLVAVAVQHVFVPLVHDEVIARPVRGRLGYFYIVFSDRGERGPGCPGHVDPQDVPGILKEGFVDAGEGLVVGGLVRVDGHGERRQVHGEDADPEPKVAGGVDAQVVGKDRHAGDPVGGVVLGTGRVDDDVTGQFGAVLPLKDNALRRFVRRDSEPREGDVAVGGDALPQEGNRSVREGVVSGGHPGHQVGRRVEGRCGGRLDAGKGRAEVTVEIRFRGGGEEGVEAVDAAPSGREIARDGEMRDGTALRQGNGRIKVRSGPDAVHGVGHADGVARRPFQGFPGPSGPGGGKLRGEFQARLYLGAFPAAENGQGGREDRNQTLVHG